jgi:HD-like signal output (HDOD) protein/ActR/RegA family two-component response regulator
MTATTTNLTRPRILFVDDEPQVLQGLSASLRRLRHTWDIEFVCGGPAALEVLAKSHFDVIVTDMRMPCIDGEAVLGNVRDNHPRSIRIVLSGQTDAQVVMRTGSIAHRFLSKPCSADDLRGCLEQLIALGSTMDESSRDLVCSIGSFPISTQSVTRLRDLFEAPTTDVDELTACIEQDCALTGKMLHLASAGFFATQQKVTSVRRAITIIGIEAVRAVALSMDALRDDARATRLFEHSLATGRLLHAALGTDEAMLCGTLHGLGQVVMLDRFGERYAALLDRVQAEPGMRLDVLEIEEFGTSHEAVGADLVALWGLSPAIGAAIRCHGDAVEASSNELATALRVACAASNGWKPA